MSVGLWGGSAAFGAVEVALDAGVTPTLHGSTSEGRWMMHPEILGGERELAAVEGGWRVTWDGVDNDPGSFDPTGLGGVDLTAGGASGHLVIDWGSPFKGVVELEVWSHGDRRSVARVEVDAGRVQVPLKRFEGSADLQQVGALRSTWRSAVASESLRDDDLAALRLALRVDSERLPGERADLGGPATVPATLVLADGDVPTGGGGNPVTSLGASFANTAGDVGFTGSVDNGGTADSFVFIGSSIVQLNSAELGVTLSGAESTMGIDDSGGFIYSPSVNGEDSVWSQNGEVLVENTQAPGFPSGTNTTFHSRPTMIPIGTAHWVAGFNETGGTASEGRVIYASPGAMTGTVAPVLRSDDLVDGLAISRPSGVDFDYGFSDDGTRHIQVLLLDTGSTADDGVVWVDGTVVAREAAPTGDGDNWDNFDLVVINDDGDFLFTGDTDGAPGSDEFIAYNGTIALREGDLVDGVTLGGSLLFLDLGNDGSAVFGWSDEHLFHACDASDLAGSAVRVLSIGDLVDLDDDGMGDGTVSDFNTSVGIGPSAPLSPLGRIFVEVDVDLGGGDLEAILELETPVCAGIFADGFESGDTSAWTSTVP